MFDMNWIDYAILAIVFFSVVIGMVRGLIKELFSLIIFIAAFFIATKYSEAVAAYFTNTPSVHNAMSNSLSSININTSQSISYGAVCISFIALFVITILIGACVNFFINFFFHAGFIGVSNHLFGIVFGFCRGIIASLVFVFILQFTSITNDTAWNQSRLIPIFKPTMTWLDNVVSPKLSSLKLKLQNTIDSSLQGM
jgi:membrane protein required for colicin V production